MLNVEPEEKSYLRKCVGENSGLMTRFRSVNSYAQFQPVLGEMPFCGWLKTPTGSVGINMIDAAAIIVNK